MNNKILKSNDIIDFQKICLIKMDHHYKQFIKIQEDFNNKIKMYINLKTGQNFEYIISDNSIIYYQGIEKSGLGFDSSKLQGIYNPGLGFTNVKLPQEQGTYKIMFSIINHEWFLYDNKLIFKSADINEVIYQYNILTNRLAIVLSDYNVDNDIEMITNLINEYKIED
jgi:hypothetical protein